MKRSTKRRLTTGALYAAFVAGVLALALLADWSTVRDNFWSPSGVAFNGSSNWPDLIKTGVVKTVEYTAIAFGGGLLLGLVIALLRQSPAAPYRWLATAYAEFFRGLPALVVMALATVGVPIAFHVQPPGGIVGGGLIGLIMVAGAYISETIRAGIQAVPHGQIEAARSLGMGGIPTTTKVVLPQAFRIIIPPLTNEFVLLIKDTALLSTLGLAANQRDLYSMAQDLYSSGPSAGTATSLIQAAVLYLIITLPLTQLVGVLERRQRRSLR